MPASPPRALRRLAGALLALAIVPALAFAAAQAVVQSESEARLAEIRDEQLDGLLFSVNQNAWDVASTWADRLGQPSFRVESGSSSAEAARAFLEATPAVRFVFATSPARADVLYYGLPAPVRTEGDTTGYGLYAPYATGAEQIDVRETLPDALVERLLAQQALGYRKLEPVALDSGGLLLVFAAAPVNGPTPRILGMAVDPSPFVETVVMPTLREVGRGGVEFGVFREGEAEPIASTAAMSRAEITRQRPLWLLPGYVVGVRVGEGSAEEALRRRAWQSVLLFGGVTLVLGAGALFAWRGVRQEVEVARLREDFVSNVSHELRTPLALIRMYGESLAEGRVPDDKKPRYYSTIVAETERLSRLVGNVLHFNRFERGTARIDRRPLDLGALAAEIGERYRPVVEREGCALRLDLPESALPILGDHDALAEALVNLIDNAVKYGDGGPVEVAARRADGSALVEVADRGPGIPPADRERVFEPFVRVQPASADGLVHTAKGTGLGLALVRRIAEAHDGTATVSARAGGGSVFRISLPSHA
ncbi:sensor histidine kinase [Rubrivirga marina]|uniref:histidine kinase n=1 Tax=Rubrivirga marina TaxID=1196024 RepID=A0A271IZB8_9BACT|nr:HAMP domain-containing sensor histidine kinase [Rubrivirga marina]PAP76601.1 hypothetical protein BSZ37_09185 [Rubrivirga marina]